MHSQGHDVTVATIARSRQELKQGGGLASHCSRYIAGHISLAGGWLKALAFAVSARPSSLGYFYDSRLHKSMEQLLKTQTFDLIWVHCSSVAQYVFNYNGCPRIMDFGDMDSEKWFQFAQQRCFPLSLIYRLEGIRLRRYEKELARRFNCSTVVSRGEQRILNSFGFPISSVVIPNGVDLQYFSGSSSQEYDRSTLIFLGRMDYYPNVDAVTYFCRSILPLVQKELPETQFLIVGSNPNGRVRSLASMPGVVVTGAVPDVRPYLKKAALSVAPLRIACGIQNKVLESMAMGVPVVASSGASDGIDAAENEHLLVDDSPEGFASKVISLLKDPELRNQLADAGRRRVASAHSWDNCLSMLSDLIAGKYTKVK